jgi:hypothetical protein
MYKDYRGTNHTLGIRNNNPGNLRPGDNWQGMAGVNQNFIVFENIVMGIRALATDLSNKFYKGLNTVSKIISVYAPPSENNTTAYINAVCSKLSVTPNEHLVWTKELLSKFVRAVIQHENGSDGSIVTDIEIAEGINKMQPVLLQKIKGF